MRVADRVYHPDGTAYHQVNSWSGAGHPDIPPYCAAEPAAEIAGRAITCDLPKGHPGPHLDVETGRQY